MSEMLGLQVVWAGSSATPGLAGLSLDGLLLKSALSRLIGLALGLLPHEQLLGCSLEAPVSMFKLLIFRMMWSLLSILWRSLRASWWRRSHRC